jgi:hypothetical protein
MQRFSRQDGDTLNNGIGLMQVGLDLLRDPRREFPMETRLAAARMAITTFLRNERIVTVVQQHAIVTTDLRPICELLEEAKGIVLSVEDTCDESTASNISALMAPVLAALTAINRGRNTDSESLDGLELPG